MNVAAPPSPSVFHAPKGLQRWLPRTLFGRLMLVLAGGLLVAQLLSAAINAAERDRLLSAGFGAQPAQRIADVVALLDGLALPERRRVVSVLRVPPLVLSLPDAAAPTEGAGSAPAAEGWHARLFVGRLRAALGDDRTIVVRERAGFDLPAAMPDVDTMHPGGMHGPGGMMMGRGPYGASGVPAVPGGMAAMAALAVLRVDVQLRDGGWARFDTELPEPPQALPVRLALTLMVLLASVLALSTVAVRWTVRPLQQLTHAADALGRDLDRPQLPEEGPREVQQAARAFNTMQRRLAGFVNDRTRLLTALSHDLKTPLTRMRLRADLLDDDDLRTRFESDLKEMEAMVTQTLEFMRGLGSTEPPAPVDVAALLAALQADNAAMGRTLHIEGRAAAPWVGPASLLRRALGNLIDNAVIYGSAATVCIDDAPAMLTLHVRDRGPGIADDQLERVFEPFHRLEGSRNRATGGTGLGLGIARNIARGFGGDVVLRNRSEGGLEATMTLPRQGVAD